MRGIENQQPPDGFVSDIEEAPQHADDGRPLRHCQSGGLNLENRASPVGQISLSLSLPNVALLEMQPRPGLERSHTWP